MRHILVLGGTTEARALARALAARLHVSVILSLAGRTKEPAPQDVPVRIGGFGGADGLAHYLKSASIDVLVDATHPYAAQISVNAARAAAAANIAFVTLRRPPWRRVAGDHWVQVQDIEKAVQALGKTPRRVFLALGRKEVAQFEAAPQHYYLIRSVELPDPSPALPNASYIAQRGPFLEADERALLLQHGIEVILARNSGGAAAYGKIAAARALGLPVMLVSRPALPQVSALATVEEALVAIDHALTISSPRGV
ncbi:MAG: cobalt-precorrin-6A reductase [Xanthobacteraceae bacterium]